MKKEESVPATKRVKIDNAQRTMLIGVFAASLIVSASVVLMVYFIRYIGFNARIIGAKDAAITGYSDAIKNSGACKKPKGKIYTDAELQSCSPNDIEVNEVLDSLRYNVLVDMASNENLESIARDSLSVCANKESGEKYTYDELTKMYENARNDEERSYYLGMVKLCSALRVVSDALPTQRNDEALMSSLNKIFLISGWEPESLSPAGNSSSSVVTGLYTIPVNLSIDATSETTLRVLSNIEKSIREFSIDSAKIEWSGELNGTPEITLTARAESYYMNPVEYKETTQTIYATGKKKGANK